MQDGLEEGQGRHMPAKLCCYMARMLPYVCDIVPALGRVMGIANQEFDVGGPACCLCLGPHLPQGLWLWAICVALHRCSVRRQICLCRGMSV